MEDFKIYIKKGDKLEQYTVYDLTHREGPELSYCEPVKITSQENSYRSFEVQVKKRATKEFRIIAYKDDLDTMKPNAKDLEDKAINYEQHYLKDRIQQLEIEKIKLRKEAEKYYLQYLNLKSKIPNAEELLSNYR